MSTSSAFLSQVNDIGVATITLNRPQQHNAFDDALIHSLTAKLIEWRTAPQVKIIVLNATGKSFSAGADLNWMARMAEYSHADNQHDAEQLGQLMQTLNTLPQPVIAEIQGNVFGGGVGLVACCDLVVAVETAEFCFSEVKLGLSPAVISPFVVNKLGASAARRYFLTAERFDAITAKALGLVHEVCTPHQLSEQSATWQRQLIQNGPQAMATSKNLLHQLPQLTEAEQFHFTTKTIADLRASAEGQEGIRAFLEKRAPHWQEDPHR